MAYFPIIVYPSSDLWIQHGSQILNTSLGFVMEIQLSKFSIDANFGLATHLTIKLQKTSPISQSVSKGLKTETQKIKLYRITCQISAFFLTINNFRLFRVGS